MKAVQNCETKSSEQTSLKIRKTAKGGIFMALSIEEIKLFYKLWLSVLQFTNKHHHVTDGLPEILVDTDTLNTKPEEVDRVSSYLLEHREILEDYVSENPDYLDQEELEIIRSWKYAVNGSFFLERILKKGGMLIPSNDLVYCVSPLVSSWEEMVRYHPLPVMVETALLPFKNQITFNGLLKMMPMMFGPGVRSNLKEAYSTVRKAGEIIDTADKLIESEKK